MKSFQAAAERARKRRLAWEWIDAVVGVTLLFSILFWF